MKLCKSCGKEKEDSLFHKRKMSTDGLAAKCKSCQSVYDKKRANNPDRVKARIEYSATESGKKSARKAKKKWANNNKGKIYEITKSYRERYPNKYKAHGVTSYAIKCGNLHREPCEVCGTLENNHAHHDDYLKPLNVRWLCAAHHNQWHKENGEGLNA